MSGRGVTRPGALTGDSGTGGDEPPQSGGRPDDEMLVRHHRQTLWLPWTVVLLGLWLMTAPTALGHGNEASWVAPSGGRGPWFADQDMHAALRADLMTWSDIVSGVLLAVLGWRALTPGRALARWAACGVGVWLVLAPVVLWAPTAAGYANDSIVGILVIAVTILIPGMPNMVRFMQTGPDTPPGWSYNPSSWPQRAILIALGFAGLLVSRYLAAYQLGYITEVWDPFFESATQRVLDSELSHTWPVSDAALGTSAYTFEFLMGFMGGTARWRTMPWMVTMFGILVIPLGLAHIALVMSQPVVVHEWCTFCLLAAALMLPMITLTIDEVVAMGQHLRDAARRGDRGGSWWKVFWLGGSAQGCTTDDRTPDIAELPERPAAVTRAAVWGANAPRALLATAVAGIWLLAAPAVFDIDIRSGAADVAHITGAFVIVVSVIALAEVARPLRWLAVGAGASLPAQAIAVAPDIPYAVALVATGLAIIALSAHRGPIREAYGGWGRLGHDPR